MSYKEETIKTYDRYAKVYADRVVSRPDKIADEIDRFLDALPGKKILDLGSGPGQESLLFKERGFAPTCVDASLAMVTLCKEKGLVAHQMDIEELNFFAGSFDGIWAYNSLIHIPKKKLGIVLKQLKKILVPGGSLFISVRDGEGEGFSTSSAYPDTRRFFSLYTLDEIKSDVSAYFTVTFTSTVTFEPITYHHLLCIND